MKPFHATGHFLYPLKTENQSFSEDFRWYKKETSGMKWVNKR